MKRASTVKNTQHIHLISSALKVSITTKKKKKEKRGGKKGKKKKLPRSAKNSPQENPKKRNPATEHRSLLLILGLVSNWVHN